ncbi:MAG: GNAT family N-acetyltransferase [Chloroflexi bacterium]|nr:GNAT family N-acetyltransferase [Chloroflexota bacterium]
MADLRSIVQAPLRLPSPLLRYRAEPTRHAVHDDVALTAYGGDGPAHNVAAVLEATAPERVFALADAFFGGTGYAVIVDTEAAHSVEAALRERGWLLDEEEPALALTPIPPPRAPPAHLTIRPVTADAELADFLAISETGAHWIPSLRAALDRAVALFVGYLGGEPIATARLTCYGEVGDLNGVVTAEAHRRQGFGTAMTWAAIAEGVRRGCTAMTLTATPMGYPVYRRMGFVPVCTYRTYLPPESAPD